MGLDMMFYNKLDDEEEFMYFRKFHTLDEWMRRNGEPMWKKESNDKDVVDPLWEHYKITRERMIQARKLFTWTVESNEISIPVVTVYFDGQTIDDTDTWAHQQADEFLQESHEWLLNEENKECIYVSSY